MATITCRWCDAEHDDRLLCDPARALLDALAAKGDAHTMPSIELGEPIPAEELNPRLGLGADDRLLVQLVVQAGLAPVGAVSYPVLVFTGRTSAGPVPRWYYAGTPQTIRGVRDLVREMADLAIRRAKEANRGR